MSDPTVHNCHPEKKIAVIILNYNNAPDTIECVRSVNTRERNACAVIVVDNCSTDDSVDTIQSALAPDEYHLIVSPHNHGYAAGNNQGIAYAVSQGYPYICILNNDTILTDDSLSRLAFFLEQNVTCSIAGPAICEYHQPGIVQSAGAKTNLLTGSVTSLYEGTPFTELPQTSYPCDYIGGACMMFRASDLPRLHYLPENYFLFFEETEWCHRATKHAGLVKCVPSLSILHKGSASITKSKVNKSELLIKNSVVFERRNATWLQFALFSLRFFVVSLGSMALHGRKSAQRFKLFAEALRETRESQAN